METLCHDGLRTRAAHLAAAAAALKRRSDAAASQKGAPFSLAFLTDRRRIANPEPVLRALPPGSAVIYRDYDDPRREACARRYRAICSGRGVLFLVAGNAALAARVGADGVHWPASGSPIPNPQSRLVTVSCHTARELEAAAAMGAHLAFLSPVFPTQSHPGAEHLGPARFRALAAGALLPVLALGGVTESNAALLGGKNVAGIAAIGAFKV
ncbi:MAG: thiamine phosphate synthase [Parvularculaceae bacterium]